MSKNEKDEKFNQKNIDNPKTAERLKEIKQRIRNYYLGKIDGKGELNKIEVLKHMQTEKFITEFADWYELGEATTVKKLVRVSAIKFVGKVNAEENKYQDFVDSISNFTNGFKFLGSDIEIINGLYGAKGISKFDYKTTKDDCIRLLDIKAKINEIMFVEHKTEAEAIRDLLSTQKSNVQLKTEEAMILRRRIDVIDGKVKAVPKKEEKSSMSKAKATIDKVGKKTNLSKSTGSIESTKTIPGHKTPTKESMPVEKAPEPVRNLKIVQERLNRANKQANAQRQGTNTLESISRAGKSARIR